MLQMAKNNTITSREVSEMVDKRHDNLIRDIRNYIDILTNSKLRTADFFINSTYLDNNGQERPQFLLTKMGCEMVANKMTGQKGIIFTARYIQRFNQMEEILKDSYMIDNPIERAKRWIQEQEEKKALLLLHEENKPKVLFHDSVQASKNSILIRDLCKILMQNGIHIGQNRMFQWLRRNGYLIKNGKSRNRPTQYAMDLKLFEIRETIVNRTEGIETRMTPLITGKGQTYFINKFLDIKKMNDLGIMRY